MLYREIIAVSSEIHTKQMNTLRWQNAKLLGAFAKLGKSTISFVMSIRPSVRMKQLGSHRTDSHEILYLKFKKKKFFRRNPSFITI